MTSQFSDLDGVDLKTATHLFKLITDQFWMLVPDMLLDEGNGFEKLLALLASEFALVFSGNMWFADLA